MTSTIQLDETIAVSRPLHEVFAYISEFSRIEEWDPAVARGVRLAEGPRLGSQFRIDMKAGFSLRYTVVEWEPNRRLLMQVDSVLFTAREEILFTRTAAAHGSAMSPRSTSLRRWHPCKSVPRRDGSCRQECDGGNAAGTGRPFRPTA